MSRAAFVRLLPQIDEARSQTGPQVVSPRSFFRNPPEDIFVLRTVDTSKMAQHCSYTHLFVESNKTGAHVVVRTWNQSWELLFWGFGCRCLDSNYMCCSLRSDRLIEVHLGLAQFGCCVVVHANDNVNRSHNWDVGYQHVQTALDQNGFGPRPDILRLNKSHREVSLTKLPDQSAGNLKSPLSKKSLPNLRALKVSILDRKVQT